MKNIVIITIIILCFLGCQSNKQYAKVKPTTVKASTLKDPENPIDTELVNWKPFQVKEEDKTEEFKKYSKAFEYKQPSPIKKRIILKAMDSKLKNTEKKLKMALHCSKNFVIMEKNLQISPEKLKKEKLMKLAEELYAQFLLVLDTINNKPSVRLYDLPKASLLHETAIYDDNDTLKISQELLEKVEGKKWEGIATPFGKENKITINLGTLDGNVKKGDKFKVVQKKEKEEPEDEEILFIEEVNEKYALATTKGGKKLSKKSKIEKLEF